MKKFIAIFLCIIAVSLPAFAETHDFINKDGSATRIEINKNPFNGSTDYKVSEVSREQRDPVGSALDSVSSGWAKVAEQHPAEAAVIGGIITAVAVNPVLGGLLILGGILMGN